MPLNCTIVFLLPCRLKQVAPPNGLTMKIRKLHPNKSLEIFNRKPFLSDTNEYREL